MITDEAAMYQDHGYTFVVVDTRGRGKSEGEWTAFVNDPADGHDVIEWVAAQPWSTGRVGMTGLSYMGWTQWAAASERPPHLTCMVSTSAAGRWQEEIPYTHGAFQLFFAWWVYGTRRRIAEARSAQDIDWDSVLATLPYGALGEFINASGRSWEILTHHDRLDEFWSSLRFDDRYDRIDVPCLHVSGWYDLEDLLGAFHHYEHMVAASSASAHQYLLVGPWSHVASRYPSRRHGGVDFGAAAAHDMDAEHLRWFDHWLKDAGPGLNDVAKVRLFDPGRRSWRTARTWPLANSTRSLYLGNVENRGVLLDNPPETAAADRYVYDPKNPALTGIDVHRYPAEDPPLRQNENEARDDVLVFTSEVLTDEVVISGHPRLELFASSDCDDTEWHVKLTDVEPDGSSLKVTQGCLRAACRESLTDLAPLIPGETARFEVELWPTHHAFLPGHRIRVTVTSSDFPWFARSMNQFGLVSEQGEPKIATNEIHHGGAFPSRILLPVENPAGT
jgi:putative CocE/NonD family hydrolase